MRKRVNAFIQGYFSVTPEPVLQLNKEFGVTHILVDRRHFTPEGKPKYFAPFNRRIARAAEATEAQSKLVEQLMDTRYAQKLGPSVSLIDVAEWAKETAGFSSRSNNH